jgi:hypothetical protein
MATPHRHVTQRSRRRAALAGSLFTALLLMVPRAHAAPPVPSNPAISPSSASIRKAYGGCFNDNTVAVLDTGTHWVLSDIPVPLAPPGLVITPEGRKVYVSRIEVGPTPHGLAISRDGRQVLVSGFGVNQAILAESDVRDLGPGVLGRVDHGHEEDFSGLSHLSGHDRGRDNGGYYCGAVTERTGGGVQVPTSTVMVGISAAVSRISGAVITANS